MVSLTNLQVAMWCRIARHANFHSNREVEHEAARHSWYDRVWSVAVSCLLHVQRRKNSPSPAESPPSGVVCLSYRQVSSFTAIFPCSIGRRWKGLQFRESSDCVSFQLEMKPNFIWNHKLLKQAFPAMFLLLVEHGDDYVVYSTQVRFPLWQVEVRILISLFLSCLSSTSV